MSSSSSEPPRKRSRTTKSWTPFDPTGFSEIRVYADGIFDLFHFGHALALKQCKELFQAVNPDAKVYLMVGVCNDELTHTMKGKTVMTAAERYESVRNCKWVDEVVEDAPWIMSPDFVKEHRIDCVAHDPEPYPAVGFDGKEVDDVYAWLKNAGKFAPTQRTDGISTSDIINRVVSEYDSFVRRNLSRGYTRKEMNLSFLREKRIRVAGWAKDTNDKVEQKLDEMKSLIKDKNEEIQSNFRSWVNGSQEFVGAFLQGFTSSRWVQLALEQSDRVRSLVSPPSSPRASSQSSSQVKRRAASLE